MCSFARYVSRLLLAIILCSGQLPVQAQAPVEPTDEQLKTEADRAAGRLTLGGRFGDSASEGYLDFLQPLVLAPNSMLFLNPKVSATDDDEEEWSIGLGARHLLAERGLILGANVFYDSRSTRHDHTFDQVGAGVELLSQWVDARANYYWPDDSVEKIDSTSETTVSSSGQSWWGDVFAREFQLRQNRFNRVTTTRTTRFYDRFEAALEGYDLEFGLRLPYLPEWLEARVFGGYYAFEGDFTEDIDGFKGRLEIRALPALVLDAEVYENDKLTGSDYMIGARLELPFDLGNLARGKNPFEGARGEFRPSRRELRDRLGDMVIRDPHVRMHESEWIEDEAARQVSSRSKTTKSTVVVLDDVNFVNNANASGIENGSAEFPWNTVQEGVDAATGRKNVYVFQGVANYTENVKVDADGVNLLGEGKAVPGFGGKGFGGGKFPKLDGNVGGINGPVIRVKGNDTLIQGFEITRTPGGANPALLDDLGLATVVDNFGILAENANNLTVFCNKINQQVVGIANLYNGTIAGSTAWLFSAIENTIEGASYAGIMTTALGPGDYSGRMVGNTIGDMGGVGVLNTIFDINDLDLEIANNRLFGLPTAMLLTLLPTNNLAARVLDNEIDATMGLMLLAGPLGGDLSLDLSGNSLFGSSFNAFMGPVAGNAEISISENLQLGGPGISLFGAPVAGDLDLWMDGNGIFNASGGGISAFLSTVGGDLFASFSENFIVNAAGGGLSVFSPTATGDVTLDVNNNVVIGSGGGGISIFSAAAGGDFFMDAIGNSANDNGGAGFFFAAAPIVGDAIIRILDSAFDGNIGGGLFLNVPSVGGDLDILIDPTTANDNGGSGIFLAATAQSNVFLTLDQVTANNNGGAGIQLVASSITGDLQVAFLDVMANNNGGPGLSASLSAYELLLMGGFDSGLSSIVGNRIEANGNAGMGVSIFGNSITGVILHATERLVANSNTAGGVQLVLSSGDDVIASFSEIDAGGNAGSGLMATLSSGGSAILNIGRGSFNDNANGLLATLGGGEMAALILGQGFLLPLLPLSGTPGLLQANDNTGSGILMTVSGGTSALILADELEARRNGGNGITSIASSGSDDVTVLLGVEFNDFTNMASSEVRADDNDGAGIALVANSGGGAVNAAIGGGTAHRNLSGGLTASLVGNEAVSLVLGGGPFDALNTQTEFGSFSANSNTGVGISAILNSLSDMATLVHLAGGASGNTAQGFQFTLVAQETALALLGGFLPQIPDEPLRFNDNGGPGLTLTLSSAAANTTVLAGGIEANRNGGSGLTVTMTAFENASFVGGLSGIMGAVETRRIQANNNAGIGLNLAAAASMDVTYFMPWLEAHGNTAGGANILLTAGAGDLIAGLGGINLPLTSVSGTMGTFASSNGAFGVNLLAVSGAKGIDLSIGAVEANENTGNGMSLVLNTMTNIVLQMGMAQSGTNTTAAPLTFVGNQGNGLQITGIAGMGSGLFDLQNITASSNAGIGVLATATTVSNTVFNLENLTLIGNTGAGLDVTAFGAHSSSLTVRDVDALNSVADGGITLTALGGDTVLLSLSNATASGNALFGVNALARGGSTNAVANLLADTLVLNNNGSTGGIFRADTGAGVTSIVRNFTADLNTGHGVLVIADSALSSYAEGSGNASSNTRYGVVAVAVGTNSAGASVNNPFGSGNGVGEFFVNASNVGSADDLLP